MRSRPQDREEDQAPEDAEELLQQAFAECQHNDSYRNGYDPRHNDVYIAIVGETGAGKSRFINWLSEDETVFSDDMDSCTQRVSVHRHKFSANRNVFLIDTPGFNDRYREDAEILAEMADWLGNSFQAGVRLHGLLVLHSIHNIRFTNTMGVMINTIRNLVGVENNPAEFLKNIILVTTRWDSNIEEDLPSLHKRHKLFCEHPDFWGRFTSKGARNYKHTNTEASAMDILRLIVEEDNYEVPEMVLAIQEELVDQGLTLSETSAGNYLFHDLEKSKKIRRDEIQSLERQIAIERRNTTRITLQVQLDSNIETDLIKTQKIPECQQTLQNFVINENTKPQLAEDYAKRTEENFNQHERNFSTLEVILDETDDEYFAAISNSAGAASPQSEHQVWEGTQLQTSGQNTHDNFDQMVPSNVDDAIGVAISSDGLIPVFEDLKVSNSKNSPPPMPLKPPELQVSHKAPSSSTLISANPIYYPKSRYSGANFFVADSENTAEFVEAFRCAPPATLQHFWFRYPNHKLAEARDSSGNNLLHAALQRRDNASVVLNLILQYIRSVGLACLVCPNNDGFLPLHFAVSTKNISVVTMLLELMIQSGQSYKIAHLSKHGWSPLALSIWLTCFEISGILSSYHSYELPVAEREALETLIINTPAQTLQTFFDICGSRGMAFWRSQISIKGTILHAATVAPIEKAKICFNAAKQATDEDRRYLVSCYDFRGMTPCALAASYGLTRYITELCCAFGDTVKRKDIINMQTKVGSAYFQAISRGHYETGKSLVIAGAQTVHDTPSFGMCGLTSDEWSSAIRGRMVSYKKKRLLRRTQTVERWEFEALMHNARFRHRQALRSILQGDINKLASNIANIYILAYCYFNLDDRSAYRYDLQQRRYCNADGISTEPIGLRVGTILYTWASRLIRTQIPDHYMTCDGCNKTIEIQKFYVCTSCPYAEYCSSCNTRGQSRSRAPAWACIPQTWCQCPGPTNHVWVLVDVASYKLLPAGYVFAGTRMTEYLEMLRYHEFS